jgi:hypothetical protein
MFKIFFPIFFLLFIEAVPQTFEGSASATSVGLNDRFEVSFTFSGQDINGLKNFSPPDFKNFLILSGPNQSTSMQIINGARSGSVSYSYYLQPRNLGKYTIGSASIVQNEKTFKTTPFNIEVIKGSTQPQKQDQDAGVSNEEIAKNLFVKAEADKRRVYKGEQVTVTYKLYTRLNIASQMSISKLPQYQGFWVEELETSSNIMFTTEVVDGKQFRVGVLKKAALFPAQTGELSVTPFELKVPVQVRKQGRKGNVFDDFFNDPFFGRTETVEFNAKSNTLKLNVIPLPENGMPENFNGAVGNYTLSADIEKKEGKTNEPISLKLIIGGNGNIKLLDVPEINLPTGFDKYEPKTNEQVKRSAVVSGKKEIEYLLIPRIAGKKEIPPINFSYFDPKKEEYVTLSTPAYTLNIEQGAVATSRTDNQEDIKALGSDIRFIKTTGNISQKNEPVIFQIGFWAAAAFPLLLLSGLVVWRKKTDKLASNIQLAKYRKAQKIARTRLKTARALMDAKKNQEFYTEISFALFGFLEDKLNIPKSDFTLEGAVEKLKSKNVEESLINDLKNTAEKCEYIRFAPSANGTAAMKEMYDHSTHIIIDLERILSSKNNA